MGLSMGLGTPLSGPSTDVGMNTAAMMDFHGFVGHAMPPTQFQNYDPFAQAPPPQQSFAPSSFVHQDTGYETMEHDGSPMDESRIQSLNMSLHQSPVMAFPSQQYDEVSMAAPLPPSAEKFRFHVTLNAPTAMIRSADEIPVTYLNKGQAYSVSIVDTMPNLPSPTGMRYRSFVRISFEDEQQRQKPATCWQLWKEGRGTNEAHHRGGKLQAVEYVEANQPAEGDDKRTRVELDTASFDGFSVIWTPGANGTTECNIAVRFNFLSTDFSHSKGVKGIPVRFCCKTEQLSSGSPHALPDPAEVAFCKVKLFRDHGAERKLSNDVAHVKKSIDKLKQQISQAETGMKDFGKRRRSSISIKGQPSQKPGKVPKHKRTWSISSASSSGGRPPVEEDLHYKLQTMQDMFTSTRPVSILYLRGAVEDDPDLHPVALCGEPIDLTKVDSADSAIWQQRSSRGSLAGSSSLVSPSPSSMSLQSQGAVAVPALPGTQGPDFQSGGGAEIHSSYIQQLASPPDQITKVAKAQSIGPFGGWIEALGVDQSYTAPPERLVKPVACFYVKYRDPSLLEKHEYYRAVYLMQRTLSDFTSGIALKFNLEPTRIRKILRVLPKRLEVEIDDDVVRELSEGQDMIVEVRKNDAPSSPIKREWEMAIDTADDSEGPADGTQDVVLAETFDLKLIF